MSRAVPEWIAKSPDEPVPPRVRLRIFQKHNGVCPVCHRMLRSGHWELDHRTALINGGENRERNLVPVCTSPCHRNKTRADVAEKSAVYERQLSHAGIKARRGPPMPGTKASGLRKRMDGRVERRS
jgi:5-methylcytosine-specific restriction protein A